MQCEAEQSCQMKLNTTFHGDACASVAICTCRAALGGASIVLRVTCTIMSHTRTLHAWSVSASP